MSPAITTDSPPPPPAPHLFNSIPLYRIRFCHLSALSVSDLSCPRPPRTLSSPPLPQSLPLRPLAIPRGVGMPWGRVVIQRSIECGGGIVIHGTGQNYQEMGGSHDICGGWDSLQAIKSGWGT
eukprot:767480-Hanusia_phi.AAC.6